MMINTQHRFSQLQNIIVIGNKEQSVAFNWQIKDNPGTVYFHFQEESLRM